MDDSQDEDDEIERAYSLRASKIHEKFQQTGGLPTKDSIAESESFNDRDSYTGTTKAGLPTKQRPLSSVVTAAKQ